MILFCEGGQKVESQRRAQNLVDNAIASQGSSENIQKTLDKLLG